MLVKEIFHFQLVVLLIKFIREEEKRKIYAITELGTEVLQLELKRIKRLYQTSQEVI